MNRHMLRAVWLVAFLVIARGFAGAQQVPPSEQSAQIAVPVGNLSDSAAEAQARLSLAVSSLDYPVTPGDVYLLTYYQTADIHVSTDVLVNGDWELNLGVFGNINARGLTFAQLKQRVENLIAESYSRSLPSLRIESPGVFRVAVTGEVVHLQYITAWGLTKLSTIVDRAKDRYSSLRTVEVRSAPQGSNRYDLLRAMRFGDESQDPHVRPGDIIVLSARGRSVTLSGEVRHPGTYELLRGEGIRDLIERFGGGTTSDADRDRVRIERNLAAQPHAEYTAIPRAYTNHVDLSDGDSVVVRSRADRRSVVWFEGAVTQPLSGSVPDERQQRRGPVTETASGTPTGAQRPSVVRFSLPIQEGEMLSDALQEVRDSILSTANLTSASILRAGETTTNVVDLAAVMARPGSSSDIPLRPNDTIFVPSLPSNVSVFGAVMAPGFFPYASGEPATFYIGLAGGIDPERNSRGKYSVTDANGKTKEPSELLRPGDRVYVPLNAFGYRVERTAPTLVAIITAIISTATFVYFTATR